jgi:lipopolysaccharide transport system ATP-binding protein
MSKPIIEVKNLSKVYNIGHEQKSAPGTLTFRDSLTQTVRKPLEIFTGHRIEQEKFWALKDVNFEVNQGDVVGIIGRNGSGKSTLLKVLSRIVEPTEGEITMRGRVASLLEVGTGFHPELTGRENVYFNGAILGMSQKEIKSKFDEIVAFSEVEKFLDTPVKFYSSGMYVRLAFAVAAHLDPDILIVDEVLAVGDAAFQKKCLGKMKDVSGQGRTVLFVSHNMPSIQSLCNTGIYMDSGVIKKAGKIGDVANAYFFGGENTSRTKFLRPEKSAVLAEAALEDGDGKPQRVFNYGSQLTLRVKTRRTDDSNFGLELRIKDLNGNPVAYVSSWIKQKEMFKQGDTIRVDVPAVNLATGTYVLDLIARVPKKQHIDNWWDDITFDVVDSMPGGLTFSVAQEDELGSVILEEATFNHA